MLKNILQKYCFKYQFEIYEHSKSRKSKTLYLRDNMFFKEVHCELNKNGLVESLQHTSNRRLLPITVETDLNIITFLPESIESWTKVEIIDKN